MASDMSEDENSHDNQSDDDAIPKGSDLSSNYLDNNNGRQDSDMSGDENSHDEQPDGDAKRKGPHLLQNLLDNDNGRQVGLRSSNNNADPGRTSGSGSDQGRPESTTPPHGRHNHHQHNAIVRTQPTSPAHLRVYRIQRNVPLQLSAQNQNEVRDDQPSTSRQGQQALEGQGSVSPPLVDREDQRPAVPQGQQAPQRLRSGRSRVHSFVRFFNQTLRNVNILWLNYEGARIRYKTLQPNQFVDVNTFVGHPWIFRDADTGDKLVVQLREVYEPIAYSVNDGWPPHRRVVKISIPVYTLQERCMQVVRDLVPPSRVNQLEIPQFLRQEIQQLIASKSASSLNLRSPPATAIQ